jgi:hypothetical protein
MLAKIISTITVIGVLFGLFYWGICNEPTARTLNPTIIQIAALILIVIFALVGVIVFAVLLCIKIWGK